MSKQPASVPFSVLIMLDKLNKAKRIYDQATDENERREADTMFADCYDWLTNHHIPIYYDQESNLWLRSVRCSSSIFFKHSHA
ncbi:MAG: hypothetical protein JOZ18_01385 [Chloroflexi bacterium]|nr:hypothetical protein [Chloroflexota bacterium]